MNDLVLNNKQLPTNIDDLSKFVLVGREKLIAVKAEIRAIDKVGLAQEVRKQKLEEAQAISEAVLDAEVRIGELMAQIPKVRINNPTGKNQHTGQNDTVVDLSKTENLVEIVTSQPQKTKAEIIKETGFTQKQAERFQTLAKYPEIVEQVKAEARENDDIVSRSAVLNKISERKQAEKEPVATIEISDAAQKNDVEHKPHVSFNSGNNEWYTPKEYIEAAYKTMGVINLDPASNEIANRVVKAEKYYTADENGLEKTWNGNIWLNPPYSSDLIGKFADKLLSERKNYTQAIVLVNNATETEWFNKIVSISSAVCFPKGRVKFYMPDGRTGQPLQGQAVLYIGDNPNEFINAFAGFGWRTVLHGVSKQ